MKCKNCGAPIEKVTEPVTGIKPYWRHVRPYTHTGRLWCFPSNDIADQAFTFGAEPEELNG